MRLDNAANIYPASLTKHYASLYRLGVRLRDDVDVPLLNCALESVSRRIPTFRCRLQARAFWWWLAPVDTVPQVHSPAPFKAFDFKEYGNLLYRVMADGPNITLDVFHALTDGGGGKTFLYTLLAEYCRLRYGTVTQYEGCILNPEDKPLDEELQDAFFKEFSGRSGKLEKGECAYHIDRADLGRDGLENTGITIDSNVLREVSRNHGCTVSEFLVAALLHSLQSVHALDRYPFRKNIIKVSLPIDLRAMYSTKTLRNFSTYINIGVDLKNKRYSLDGLIKAVNEQKKEGMRKEVLEDKIIANVELEQSFIVRAIPLFIKKFAIDSICRAHGDKFVSYTLSNLGNLTLPPELAEHVDDMECWLGRQRGTSGAATCASYNGRLHINMTRKIRDNSLESHFVRLLESEGVPCEVTEKTLA